MVGLPSATQNFNSLWPCVRDKMNAIQLGSVLSFYFSEYHFGRYIFVNRIVRICEISNSDKKCRAKKEKKKEMACSYFVACL